VRVAEIRSLTGLRAVAALGVYFHHFGNPPGFPNRLSNLQNNGGFGVSFFFVLSGFVLTLTYAKSDLNLRTYFVKRISRIFPIYWFGLSLAFVFVSLDSLDFGKVFLVHFLGLQSWFLDSDLGFHFNGPGWSISVEMFFYLLFPLLLTTLIKGNTFFQRWQSILVLAMIVSIIPFFVHLYFLGPLQGIQNAYIWPPLLPVHYLGLFILGMCGCQFTFFSSYLDKRPSLRGLMCDVSILVFLLILVFVNFKDPENPLLAIAAQFWILGLPSVCVLVVLTGAPTSLSSRLLSWRPVWFAGKCSMVFYLIHVPTTWWIQLAFPSAGYELRFALVACLTVITHLCIENPANRLIKKILI
jgi:peptidoglycan/LPS O-acetylase OafA/YrhL